MSGPLLHSAMKNIAISIAAALMVCACTSSVQNVIVPQPKSIEYHSGRTSGAIVPDVTVTGQGAAESYTLDIAKGAITITAADEAGAFYAQQSLAQLRDAYGDRIPCQTIVDEPRFPYRGVHLDVSRHFQDKDFIKKQLLLLSRLKINRFHFHLVDGVGWRIQIDKYPLLTEVAAWRRVEDFTKTRDRGVDLFCTEDTPGAYGGYYTKDDLREIVAFADSLHITVIPEIEMFGHSSEVLAVYPELGCNGPADVFCIGNDATFEFLENVLDEVMEIFPSQYIHIGGDEANKSHWEHCELCQARIRREGLDDVDGLQSYGIARIERFVNSRGRSIIGWDEILEGGLAPNAAVMSWRGEEGGRAAAAAQHYVVMTPGEYCYLDKCQDDPSTEPPSFGGNLSTAKVYSYDPAPADMPGREYVMGVQTNLWTEYVLTPEHVEHMLYPRVYALAEIAWSEHEGLDYAEFLPRALRFNDYAVASGYHPFDLATAKGEREGFGEVQKHLALGCKVTYGDGLYTEKYSAGGDGALTDGLVGGWSYFDHWQGFLGTDVVATVDLGSVKKVSEISISFGQWRTSEVVMPVGVRFEVSKDGEEFELVDEQTNVIDFDERRSVFQTFSWKTPSKPLQARFVRVTGKINDDKWGWLFTDEIFVK